MTNSLGIIQQVGAQRVVVAIDVRAGHATGAGWRDGGRPVADVVDQVSGAGAIHVLVTGIERDGTRDGLDLALTSQVKQRAPHFEVIGSGGVGSLNDVRDAARSAMSGLIVGRALYDDVFTLEEARATAAETRRTGA